MILRKCNCNIFLRVPHVEKELLTLPGHLGSLPVFSGYRVARSLVLCVFDKRNISVSKSINLTHIYMTHHFLVCVCVFGEGARDLV
jgi:hypothetical protein